MTDRQDSRFLVVIHDVAWPFSAELRTIVGMVRNLVGSQFAAGLVPMWHSKDARGEQQRIMELISDCDEYLLHGWTHQCVRRSGLVSWLTRRSDEFTRLARAEIQQRIDFGRQAISDLTGTTVAGLLPPAWQLPVAARELSGLSYVMRFARLESCLDPPAVRPLATWSFDWGWLKPAGFCGDLMGTARWSYAPVMPFLALRCTRPMLLAAGCRGPRASLNTCWTAVCSRRSRARFCLLSAVPT